LPEGGLEAHFRSRPRFSVAGGCARYDNADTGVSFEVRLEDGALTLELEVPRPPCFALEAALALEASAAELGLQPEGDDGELPFDLARAYEVANAAAHTSLVDSGEEPIELSDELLERAWRWNFGREDHQRAAGTDVQVPPIEVVVHPDTDRPCL